MQRLTAHLNDVDESYFQHLRHALSFSLVMLLGSIVCLIHALCPFLFERTGSNYIRTLHDRMVTNRHQLTPRPERQSPSTATMPQQS